MVASLMVLVFSATSLVVSPGGSNLGGPGYLGQPFCGDCPMVASLVLLVVSATRLVVLARW